MNTFEATSELASNWETVYSAFSCLFYGTLALSAGKSITNLVNAREMWAYRRSQLLHTGISGVMAPWTQEAYLLEESIDPSEKSSTPWSGKVYIAAFGRILTKRYYDDRLLWKRPSKVSFNRDLISGMSINTQRKLKHIRKD